MDPQIVPADKRLRVVTLLAAVVVLLAGGVMLAMLRAELRALHEPGGGEAGKGGKAPDAARHADEAPGGVAPVADAVDPLEAAIERLERWTSVLGWIGGLSFVGIGFWMFVLGWRVNRAGQYPPPGMKVVRDTRIRTGAQARTLANVLQLAAFALISAGVVGTWWLHQMALRILHHAGR